MRVARASAAGAALWLHKEPCSEAARSAVIARAEQHAYATAETAPATAVGRHPEELLPRELWQRILMSPAMTGSALANLECVHSFFGHEAPAELGDVPGCEPGCAECGPACPEQRVAWEQGSLAERAALRAVYARRYRTALPTDGIFLPEDFARRGLSWKFFMWRLDCLGAAPPLVFLQCYNYMRQSRPHGATTAHRGAQLLSGAGPFAMERDQRTRQQQMAEYEVAWSRAGQLAAQGQLDRLTAPELRSLMRENFLAYSASDPFNGSTRELPKHIKLMVRGPRAAHVAAAPRAYCGRAHRPRGSCAHRRLTHAPPRCRRLCSCSATTL